MEFLRESRLPAASATRDQIEAARDNLLRRRQLNSDDHILSPRERRAFGSEERKLNAAIRDAPHDYAAGDDPPLYPSWKKRKEAQTNNVLAFVEYRHRIIDHLSSHLEANTTSKLLRELPKDFKASRLSVHQQLNVQKKAQVVVQYCIMINATYDRSSPYHGWSADQVASCVGNNFRERPNPKKVNAAPSTPGGSAPSTPALSTPLVSPPAEAMHL